MMVRLGLLLALCVASPALSQTNVGRAIVEGRTVTLFDNKSWAFADAATPGCAALSSKLSFCGDPDVWQPTAKPKPDALVADRIDSLHYAQVIEEELGTAQGVTLPMIRQFILDFAQQQTNAPPIVVSTKPAQVGTMTGETMVYAFTIMGVDTVYANTILLGETSLVQLITYQIGSDYTDRRAELHADFNKNMQVTQ